MKKFFSGTRLFLLVALMAAPAMVWAQTGADCGPSAAPVDGGLSFLLIAGAASYGAKKISEKRKKNAEMTDK